MFSLSLLTSVLIGVSTILAQSPAGDAAFGGFICQVDASENALAIGQAAVRATGGTLGHVYTHALNGFSIRVPPGIAVAHLRAQRGVILAEPDLVMHTCTQILPTGVNRIDAEGASGPVDVDIAIIDTGVGPHEDLNIAGGIRFYSRGLKSYSDENYADDNGHGTHCAGIAAAKNNDLGVVGVAPGARIWAVKVLGANGSGRLSDIIAGIDWVTKNAGTIKVANMSLGGTGVSSTYQQAIRNSVSKGVVYVVAAGNESDDVYGPDGVFGTSDDHVPAAYPEVMTISALADTDGLPGGAGGATDDRFASFSNYSRFVVTNNPVSSPGAAVDLILPGVSIYSTLPNNSYGTYSGTSMASPHAAGLVARYIAVHGAAGSASGVYAIRQALIDAGKAQGDPAYGLTHDGDPDSYPERIGWAGSAGPVDENPTVAITYPVGGGTVAGKITVTADADDDNGVARVQFFIDGSTIGVDASGGDGWSADWVTTEYADGDHEVSATATDTAGQTATASVTVTVDNVSDPVVPTISIANPTDGATVSGSIEIAASATHTTKVEFLVDGALLYTDEDGADGWTASWNTEASSDGSHVIMAVATGDGGTATASVTVTVDNVTDPILRAVLSAVASWVNPAKWEAAVTVTVTDGEGPVPGAVVFATWTPGVSTSGMTDIDGVCILNSGTLSKQTRSVVFTVVDIVKGGYAYTSDADSITISQPSK